MTQQLVYTFDSALDLQRREDGVLVRERLHQAWNVGDSFFNGGYLHALTARAAVLAAGAQPDPVAVSTSFIAPVRDEVTELHTEVLNAGRTVSTVNVRLVQGGRVKVQSMVTLGELPGAGEPAPLHPMPDVPGPEDCPDRSAQKQSPAWSEVVDLRLVPGYDGWTRKDYSDTPEMLAWLRFRDGRPLDPMSVVAFSDMTPPAAFALGRFGWAPTLQLMVGMFARPQGEWALLHVTGSPYGENPYGCEDSDIWTVDGTLVCRARQVALPPRPRVDGDPRSGH